jgi:hypothetical protein
MVGMHAWLLFGHLLGVVLLLIPTSVYAVAVARLRRAARTATDLRALLPVTALPRSREALAGCRPSRGPRHHYVAHKSVMKGIVS